MWLKYITNRVSSYEDDSLFDSKQVEEEAVAQDPKCFKCQKQQRSFICGPCVQKGCFSMSKQTGSSDKETFVKKQSDLKSLKKDLKECTDLCEQRQQDAVAYENLKFEVNEKERRLEVLQKVVEEKRAYTQKLREERKKLQLENVQKCEKVSQVFIDANNADKEFWARQQHLEKLREANYKAKENLEKCRRSKIQQLISYIFPISIERRHKEKTDVVTTEQENEWVFYAEGIDEVQHRIVAPTLPANGDYAGHLDMLEDNKEDSYDIQTSQNAGYCTLGALTYTTQLVQLMYHFLGVRMPHKLTYSAFCKDLGKDKILKKIMKLNLSIMYLAYTQNVQLHTMNEMHTLENIMTILDTKRSELGRFGFHTVGNAPLIKSVDSLLMDIDSMSQDESDTDSEAELDSDISFCTDSEKIPAEDMQEATTAIKEEEPSMTQSFITAATTQINYIFGWMK